jgi:hypothetical protein
LLSDRGSISVSYSFSTLTLAHCNRAA